MKTMIFNFFKLSGKTTTPSSGGGGISDCDFTHGFCNWMIGTDDEERENWSRGNTNTFTESNTECPDVGHTQENKNGIF
jgi:hypothetical protein